MTVRRDRVEIWTDILLATRAAGDAAPPSRVQTRANLPHDRFWRHVAELTDRGLMEREPLRPTPAGERFLTESAAMRGLLRDGTKQE